MFNLINVSVGPHELFHRSPKLFDFPCRQKINDAREWSPWHANGVMGLWCSTIPNSGCSEFGEYTYKISINPNATIKGVHLKELYAVTHDMEDFSELIEHLENNVDVLYVIDGYPLVGEVIIINFSSIASFELVDKAEDRRVPLEHY